MRPEGHASPHAWGCRRKLSRIQTSHFPLLNAASKIPTGHGIRSKLFMTWHRTLYLPEILISTPYTPMNRSTPGLPVHHPAESRGAPPPPQDPSPLRGTLGRETPGRTSGPVVSSHVGGLAFGLKRTPCNGLLLPWMQNNFASDLIKVSPVLVLLPFRSDSVFLLIGA